MFKKNKKYFLLAILFFLLFDFSLVLAQDVTFTPQIEIPDSKFKIGEGVAVDGGRLFIDYMSAIYKWAVGAIAIIAVIMIMVAGFQWMTAAGSASAIGQAKSRISSSLIGLLLAIGAYSLLNFVNPSLVYLRTLDIGNIDKVALNISEKYCYDGKIRYRWNNYICFSISHDGSSQEFFPLMDFGIEETIPSEKISYIDIDLGVGSNYVSQCDVDNGFNAIVKKVIFTLMPSTTIPWFGCLHKGSDGNFCETFDDTVKDGGTIIKVKADFNSSSVLSGLSFITANKSAGKASAYFSNIIIKTKETCVVCCKHEKSKFFQSGFACRGSETLPTLSDCCTLLCVDANTSIFCDSLSSYCNMSCKWSPTKVNGIVVGGTCSKL